MKILVTGASGFVGSALLPALASAGHQVTALVRRPPRPGAAELQWNPLGQPDPAPFSGADAVVHLAGENIAAGRWNPRRKALILNSRVQSTQAVAAAMARANPRPRVLVSASAIGYYGDRGSELLTETASPGSDFLADVALQWESATQAAGASGVRVVCLRTGLVLSARGGALPRMLTPFRLGLGGPIGNGQQWMSWITLDDLVSLIRFALENDRARGPVNAVAPNPVANADFTKALAHALHRPAIFPLPAFMVRLLFGEMGQALLLGSQRVQPAAALAAGFTFRHPDLASALQHVLQ